MRVIFGLLGLVLTLFVVMQLVKTQTATVAPVPVRAVDSAQPNVSAPQGNPKQVQEQYQQALEGALKAGQARNEAAEKP